MSVDEFRSCTSDARAHAVRDLTALLNSVHAELMDLVAAADAEEDWREDGAVDVVSWVEGRTGMDPETVRAWRRVGRTLAELPHLRAAFTAGRFSWPQIRTIARFATPEEDEVLATELVGCSLAQLEHMARARRRMRRRERDETRLARRLRRRRDRDLAGVHYSMFVPDADAATIDAALERDIEAAGPDAETGTWAPADQRRADAVVEWAARSLGDDDNVDLATVVIHANAEAMRDLADPEPSAVPPGGTDDEDGEDGEPVAVTDDGGVVPATDVLRILCEARVEWQFHDTDGSVVGIAEAARTIPAWLRRHILHRDLRCRFPGCNRRIRHIHHIVHWARGGPTDSDNLIGLCWHHHHLVHDPHLYWRRPWTITGDPNTSVTFHHPGGATTFVSTVRPNQTRRRRPARVTPADRAIRLHTGRRLAA